MADETAIRIERVSKDFILPHEKVNSLKGAFTGLAKRGSNAKKTKEVQRALRDIDFTVRKGEFFGIVGRNGSGKSTLLKILAGIYQPTKGKVHAQGRLVPFIELGVGFNPELTGRENVYLNGAMLGFSRKEISAMYNDIVEFAELERFMDQKLKNYSSGMQVRLAFSMATRSEADILLVDEVLAVGDADFQRKCFGYFRSLKRDHKTVVFVSHDMQAIREYCDRCAVIDSAELRYVGDPEAATEKYTQLFNATMASTNKVEDAVRWGDGSAQFLPANITVTKPKVTIKTAVEFKAAATDPIIGILIKNASGETICGTNNKIIGKLVGVVDAGTKKTIEWSLPNIFSDDKYTIDLAISHADGVTQADWWHDAASFTVRNEQTTPYNISPPVEMKIS